MPAVSATSLAVVPSYPFSKNSFIDTVSIFLRVTMPLG